MTSAPDAAARPARRRHRPRMRSSALMPTPRAGTARPSRRSSRRPRNVVRGGGVARQDHRAAERQPAQAVEHLRLGRRVQMRGRLIQQQQRRVLQEGAGDRDALRLAAGQPVAALADRRVEPVAAAPRRTRSRGRCGRPSSTSASVASGRANRMLSRMRAGEQHRTLADPGGQPRQRLRHQVGDVGAVDGAPARCPGARSPAGSRSPSTCRRRTARPAPASRRPARGS